MTAFTGNTLQPPSLVSTPLASATQTVTAWSSFAYVAAAMPRQPKVKLWNGTQWVLAPTEPTP